MSKRSAFGFACIVFDDPCSEVPIFKNQTAERVVPRAARARSLPCTSNTLAAPAD
ncbi:hypothetical protein GGQ67_002982 [Rhizobium metallidurans]|uniref:Uncharacterized protein n=1 Tax=Rhizobium metallidurans TaxID=1265931 RepID=A0A7W6CSE6_9HYPH|nr:hypothetical protein [Rhizobium metallidurans]